MRGLVLRGRMSGRLSVLMARQDLRVLRARLVPLVLLDRKAFKVRPGLLAQLVLLLLSLARLVLQGQQGQPLPLQGLQVLRVLLAPLPR